MSGIRMQGSPPPRPYKTSTISYSSECRQDQHFDMCSVREPPNVGCSVPNYKATQVQTYITYLHDL